MIATVHLFPILNEKLIQLLRSLSADDWDKKAIGRWTVKDVASHLLDTAIRTLSSGRDGHGSPPDREINSYQTLVDYLNHLNAEWVSATKRLSPGILTDLLETYGIQYDEYLATRDLTADAPFSVAWAGETTSKNWFHIARDYTERWHHQQQIRDAVGKQGIMTKELFYPVIDTLMYGLPYTYRHVVSVDGTSIKVSVDTEIGGDWFLMRDNGSWHITKTLYPYPDAHIVIPPDIAWKLFTKGIRPDEAMDSVMITGNKNLALPALDLVAVMA